MSGVLYRLHVHHAEDFMVLHTLLTLEMPWVAILEFEFEVASLCSPFSA